MIKEEGLPIYHDSGHGDLFVEYNVVFPMTLSAKTQASLSSALNYIPPSTPHVEL